MQTGVWLWCRGFPDASVSLVGELQLRDTIFYDPLYGLHYQRGESHIQDLGNALLQDRNHCWVFTHRGDRDDGQRALEEMLKYSSSCSAQCLRVRP